MLARVSCALQALHALGLRPETAFGCILNFLLDLQPSVKQHFSDILEVLTNPRVLKIGLQMRFGDATFHKQHQQVAWHHQPQSKS